MNAERGKGYSREAYEKGEKETEESIDNGARAAELAPKFAKQEELKSEAWSEALAEDKARDVREAAELARSMRARAESPQPPQMETELPQQQVASRYTDEALFEFAKKYIDPNQLDQFGIGKWHGKDRMVFLADQLRANRDDIRNDRTFGWARIPDWIKDWRARRAFKKQFGTSVDSVLETSKFMR